MFIREWYSPLCQQCQEVSRVRRQVFCKPHMASGQNYYFAATPFPTFHCTKAYGKRPCCDAGTVMMVLWHNLSGDTWLYMSTTWLTYLGPSIVKFWFIPTEVTKGRQHVVLNTNETMESHCVQAQKQAQRRKGGWLCWTFWRAGVGVSF